MTVIDLTPAPPAAAPVGSQGAGNSGQRLPAFAWLGPWPPATTLWYAAGGSKTGQAAPGTFGGTEGYRIQSGSAESGSRATREPRLTRITVGLPHVDGPGPFAPSDQETLGSLAVDELMPLR
jgi:hypothetical protein